MIQADLFLKSLVLFLWLKKQHGYCQLQKQQVVDLVMQKRDLIKPGENCFMEPFTDGHFR